MITSTEEHLTPRWDSDCRANKAGKVGPVTPQIPGKRRFHLGRSRNVYNLNSFRNKRRGFPSASHKRWIVSAKDGGATPIVSRKQRVFEHVMSWRGLVRLQHLQRKWDRKLLAVFPSQRKITLWCFQLWDTSRQKNRLWLSGVMSLVDWFQGVWGMTGGVSVHLGELC